jgi:hypothetical protein
MVVEKKGGGVRPLRRTEYYRTVCFVIKELRSRKMKRNEKDVTIPVRK